MRNYHLIILEIELMNRMNKESFQKAHGKIAILPRCLRFQDLKSQLKCCNSDYGKLFVNQASNIFLDFGIDAYLWMSSSLKSVFKVLKSNREHFAVIGMASIPELYSSMQKCMKLGVPVIGVPLAANPCQRFTANVNENNIYFQEVEKLLNC